MKETVIILQALFYANTFERYQSILLFELGAKPKINPNLKKNSLVIGQSAN
jgi:hypothetical protein